MLLRTLLLLPLLSLVAACGTSDEAPARLQVGVQAKMLSGVTDARYTVQVANERGDVLWTENVSSSAYGNGGGGDITYIGPCDASDYDNDGTAKNQVTLTLDELVPLAASEWANPGTLALQFECKENADTSVEFNLTIMRDANSGFVDVGVNLDEVFCSAKFDCLYDNGSPIQVVPDAFGERAPSLVLAIACTAGPADDLHLYANNPRLVCDDGSSYALDMAQIGARTSPNGGAVVGQVVTAGVDLVDGMESLYWTGALGLDVAARPQGACSLQAQVTATNGPLAQGEIPAGSVYPVIEFDVPVYGTSGGVQCTQHPLGGGNGVAARYGYVGGRFEIELDGDLATGTVSASPVAN